jgi:hypothetical protein
MNKELLNKVHFLAFFSARKANLIKKIVKTRQNTWGLTKAAQFMLK